MSDFIQAIKFNILTRLGKRLLIWASLLLVWGLVSSVLYHVWIHGADHRDFYPRWAGARAVLEGSRDLYSIEATNQIQLRLYDKVLPSDQDQQGFAYPAYFLPLLLPFALLGDVEVATAVWTGFSFVLFIISIFLLQDQNHQRSSPVIPVVVFLLWYYPLIMIFQAQTTGFVLASLGLGYWAYKRKNDLLAGFLLSMGLIKPELVLLPTLTLLVFGLLDRRFRFIFSFCLLSLTLLLASFVLVGWWIQDWIMAIQSYNQYAKIIWPLAFFWDFHPALAFLLVSILAAILFKLRKDKEAFFASSIPIQMILVPQTLIYSLTMACLPLTVAWKRGARLPVLCVWLLGWVIPFLNMRWGLWNLEFVLISALSLFILFPVGRIRESTST